MSKFDHLKKLSVEGSKTVDFIMHDLEGAPVLQVLPATEANKPFWNATLRNLNKKKGFAKKQVTPELIERNRNDDRKLYPIHIIKGWDKMVSPDGSTIMYTGDDCIDFMQSLPNHIFDELREFCTDTANFIDYDIDAEEVAGN